ncbi:MAG TPA: amino acid adenylation domain-containing protein [Gaiellaceae bacterium]|nr:amino acid adenylation domain-containing protein [Gaiellaceae bacterium]
MAEALDDPDVRVLLAHLTPDGDEPPAVPEEARAALKHRLAERVASGGGAIYPLSANQTSLWYMHQLAPSSAAYHVGAAARLQGDLDIEAFARAVQAVSDRHAALRTRFLTLQGRPFQEVHPRLETPLKIVDCSGVGEPALIERVQRDYEVPRDLEHGPVFRVALYTRPGEQPVVLFVIHHAFMDLWAFSVVLHDLGQLYAAEHAGTPADLPSPTGYPEFVRWQRELLQSDGAEAQAGFWEERLEGMPPVLDLPADQPRPPLHSQRGRAVRFELDRESSMALVRLARAEGTTTFVVLLAAYQALMHRYTGQDDLGVGTPVAGRSDARFRELAGHCVNMAVIRARFGADTSFREHLAATRKAVAEAMKNEDFPFSQLVGRLGVQQDPSRSPLFQTCFILQQSPLIDLNSLVFDVDTGAPSPVGGLLFEPFPIWVQQGQFDLSLWMARIAGRFHGELKFRDDLLERATVDRLAHHYEVLLRGIIADPDAPVSRLPLLDDAERSLVVDEWNETAHPYQRDACMHELFEEQAERTPDAVAVASADRSLTYAELEERANRLAQKLRSLGVGRGSLVALFVDRSPDTIVALLGILKAGGGYVPLETHYPPARIQFIVESLGVRVAVSESARLEQLESVLTGLVEHVVCVDDEAALAEQPSARVADGPAAETTAYIIFTSGSTGTPKGVEVQHRTVINLIEWVNRTYGVGPGDRLLFITSLSFDLSVYDVFGSLAAGATIRIAAREEIQDPHRLTTILAEDGITIWDSAPPALNQLVPFLPEAAPDNRLRLALLSGDWIPVKLPDQIRAVFEDAKVVSLGGATEATIWSNSYDIGEVDPSWVSIPYGKPIQNARYYVLDGLRNPCPIGVPGDLFIGGECLAAGYVNDPELTASKFVRDPFSSTPGARMYDTGDRARFFPDGNIEFLGRRDFQVKIRGYRIELGEIESVLAEHPSIGDCTVIARDDDGGSERYLAAYVVPSDGEAPASTDLRAFLKERLPEFMVPQHFMALERLPLTPNGKVDWRSLPVPERRREELGTEYVEPATDTERLLAEIWKRVLAVDRVGATDNFFDLGGYSLLAVQVVYELESRTGVVLPVSSLLQAPTVRELGQRLEAGADGSASVLVPLRDGERRPPLFLLHPSGGEVIAYRVLVDGLDPGRPLVGVQAPSRIGRAEPGSVEEMARVYADAIREAEPTGPYLLAGWSLGGVLAHATAFELERAGETVALCALIDSVMPHDRPELLDRVTYRLGAVLGPLAGALAGEDESELRALLELPEGKRIERATRIARERGDALADLPREALEREIAIAAVHATVLAEHAAAVVDAPLRLVWAEETLFDGVPPTDWTRHSHGGVEQAVLTGAHHYSVLDPPHLVTLVAQLGQWLSAATPGR